jgi:GNAT superfamily N-acetyltransferase
MDLLHIEEHRRENDELIFDLQQLQYPDHPTYKDRDKTRRYWQWRYFSSPDIISRVFVVKGDDGRIVAGMRPISILPVQCNGAPLSCLMLTAVITHPDFRNKGIFSNLVKHSRKEAERLGAAFAFTFPNEKSFAIYKKKTEWAHIGSLPLHVKVLDCSAVLEKKIIPSLLTRAAGAFGQCILDLVFRSRKIASAIKIDIKAATGIDDSYNQLWQRVAGDYCIAVKRNGDYLKWRYFDKPDTDYIILEAREKRDSSLKGYIVITTQDRFNLKLGLIVDILVESGDENTSALLIAEALTVFKNDNVPVVCCLMQKHYPYAHALKMNGFICIPDRVSPKKFYFIGSALAPQGLPAEVFEFKNWYLTWGDTDNV